MNSNEDKSAEKKSLYVVSEKDFETIKSKSITVESDKKPVENNGLEYFFITLSVAIIFFHHQIFNFIYKFFLFLTK